MKVVAGLGNPGSQYDDTRHNVGWWAVDRLAFDWRFGPFRRDGTALTSGGRVGSHSFLLVKPLTFVNRSGSVVASLSHDHQLDVGRDLLVVVDDVALEVGHLRMRASGGAGGHNGLKSVEAALGTQDYARLRIGVGPPPVGLDLTEWVLSPMPPEDEDVVVELLPLLASGVEAWSDEGVEAAMRRLNR